MHVIFMAKDYLGPSDYPCVNAQFSWNRHAERDNLFSICEHDVHHAYDVEAHERKSWVFFFFFFCSSSPFQISEIASFFWGDTEEIAEGIPWKFLRFSLRTCRSKFQHKNVGKYRNVGPIFSSALINFIFSFSFSL